LNMSKDDLDLLLAVDVEGWKKEADDIAEYYKKFGSHLPPVLHEELGKLRKRLEKS